MDRSFWQRLDTLIWLAAPFLLTVLLVLLAQVPMPLPDYGVVSPALATMSIYYWALYRPGVLPAPAVFVIGLLQDMLSGTPVGVNAFVFLVAYGITVSQRRFFRSKSLVVVWAGFVPIAALVGLVQWLLMSLMAGILLGPEPVLAQLLLTAALYPVLAWVLVQSHRALARSEAS